MGRPADQDLTPDEWARIDAVCDRFESAWRDGKRPVIADYLESMTETAYRHLLRELILLDIEYRQIHGEKAQRADYESEFPQSHESLQQVFDVSLGKTFLVAHHDTPHDKQGSLETLESVTDPNVGKVIGSYRILDRLGKGGMGTVYRAAHTMIDCERAIKFLQPNLANDPQAVKRFLQEAQASIVHLSHPNIVKTYELNREGDKIYLVMEVLSGEDLSHLVRRAGPIPLFDAAQIIEQAATGLAYAHGLGFVHRDVKPQNIMLTIDGTVKILDLGLVRALEAADRSHQSLLSPSVAEKRVNVAISDERLTDGNALLGTLSYMSPEQAGNPHAADARSDLYSLGATLYFLLTGEQPFKGATKFEVLQNVLANKYVPVRRLRPEIPESLERILQQLMAARPSDRFSNGKQLAKALRSWRLQMRLEQSPQGLTEPVTFDTEDDLHLLLRKFGIISQADWANAGQAGGRARTSWRAPMQTTMLAPYSASGPEQILEILEAMYSASGGKQGLSPWQKQNILQGNADLLRFPHHILIDRIGVGWKGEVYKARNTETGAYETIRTFAASSLYGFDGDETIRLQQFVDRISKIAALQHPIFPVINRYDTCHNRHYQHIGYVVTEFIDGLIGRDAIQRSMYGSVKNRLAWALGATARLARGLQIAHDAGIFHLDIHDKSIRFDSVGNIWLTDLGIAELVTKRHSIPDQHSGSLAPEFATLAPSPIGTPYIMAPEQLIGDAKSSSAIDVYNLGCTLCYLIVGEYPFKADNVSQLQQLVLSQSPAKSDVVRQIARPIQPLIVRMLAKLSENRPTAGEVANEIEEFLNSLAAPRDIESKPKGSWLSRTFANWWPRAKVIKESEESGKVW